LVSLAQDNDRYGKLIIEEGSLKFSFLKYMIVNYNLLCCSY